MKVSFCLRYIIISRVSQKIYEYLLFIAYSYSCNLLTFELSYPNYRPGFIIM
jgi:hypothetical protein